MALQVGGGPRVPVLPRASRCAFLSRAWWSEHWHAMPKCRKWFAISTLVLLLLSLTALVLAGRGNTPMDDTVLLTQPAPLQIIRAASITDEPQLFAGGVVDASWGADLVAPTKSVNPSTTRAPAATLPSLPDDIDARRWAVLRGETQKPSVNDLDIDARRLAFLRGETPTILSAPVTVPRISDAAADEAVAAAWAADLAKEIATKNEDAQRVAQEKAEAAAMQRAIEAAAVENERRDRAERGAAAHQAALAAQQERQARVKLEVNTIPRVWVPQPDDPLPAVPRQADLEVPYCVLLAK